MNSLGKIMGGFASFWILAIGLVLIFTAGPIIGCATVLALIGIWAYINFNDQLDTAVDEVERLRDVLEEIEESVELPRGYAGSRADYYEDLAQAALLRDGKVDLGPPADSPS